MRTGNGRSTIGALAALLIAMAATNGVAAEPAAGGKPDVELTVVGVLYEGTKIWVPGTVVAHQGDRVKINLINNIPGDPTQHGWAVDAFKAVKVVNKGEPTSVEFVADKTGVFPIYCQLHPAHVGGQLVVLPRQ
jgi:nitrosocyanin